MDFFAAYGVWVCIGAAAFAMLFWVLGRRAAVAQRRSAQNLCLDCGYDLRATRTRCPECGAIPFKSLDEVKLRKSVKAATEFPEFEDEELDTTVHKTTKRAEARLLVTCLQVSGMPARLVDGELAGNPFLVLFQVQVRASDRDKAARFVSECEADEKINDLC